MGTLNELALLGIFKKRCLADVEEKLKRITGDTLASSEYWDYLAYFRSCGILGISQEVAKQVLHAFYNLRLGEVTDEDAEYIERACNEVDNYLIDLDQYPSVREYLDV